MEAKKNIGDKGQDESVNFVSDCIELPKLIHNGKATKK